MAGNGKKGKKPIRPGHVMLLNGIPVGDLASALIKVISTHVTHCDNFSPCITWNEHKKGKRVDNLWNSLKGPWGLPDDERTKKWFNFKARNRCSDFKTKTLKPNFDAAEGDFILAIASRPVKFINEAMWETLCKQFAKINDPGDDPEGRSKSQKCKDARETNIMNHSIGRASLETWTDQYNKKFGKLPDVTVCFDKLYLRIDPLEPSSSESHEGEEGSQTNPGITRDPVVRQLSAQLHKSYDDAINAGSDESTANTISISEVFGRSTRCLGFDALKVNKQISKRPYSSTQGEVETLREELIIEKKKREDVERSFGSVMAYLRQQGFKEQVEQEGQSHVEHNTNSNDHGTESNEDDHLV